MPPRKKISKEMILEQAFDITKKEGFEAITVRRLAGVLGCSTQPIYQEYKDMKELKYEVIMNACKLFSEYRMEILDEDIPALQITKAYLLFASRESKLFQLIFTTKEGNTEIQKLFANEKINQDFIIYVNGLVMMNAFHHNLNQMDNIMSHIREVYLKLNDWRKDE